MSRGASTAKAETALEKVKQVGMPLCRATAMGWGEARTQSGPSSSEKKDGVLQALADSDPRLPVFANWLCPKEK